MILLFLALLVFLAFLAGIQLERKRQKAAREQRGLLRAWPIPKISISKISPLFELTQLGPSLSTEVAFIANYRVTGGISDLESWILCTLAKQAQSVFEFGTCTGKTTYLLARNAPPEARIYSLTLRPQDLATLAEAPTADASRESQFTRFYYSGTEEEKKIVQLYGDSKAFDETPHLNQCDLIFVDGSHERSYVENDSQKALRMIRPGGMILWHDFHGRKRNRDVFAALGALAKTLPLRHIEGTSLVFLKLER